MPDAQDNLTDGELQSEIELVGDLVVAATSSDGPMRQEEIDRLLGVQAAAKVAAQQEGSSGEIDAGQETEPSKEQAPETD